MLLDNNIFYLPRLSPSPPSTGPPRPVRPYPLTNKVREVLHLFHQPPPPPAEGTSKVRCCASGPDMVGVIMWFEPVLVCGSIKGRRDARQVILYNSQFERARESVSLRGDLRRSGGRGQPPLRSGSIVSVLTIRGAASERATLSGAAKGKQCYGSKRALAAPWPHTKLARM